MIMERQVLYSREAAAEYDNRENMVSRPFNVADELIDWALDGICEVGACSGMVPVVGEELCQSNEPL